MKKVIGVMLAAMALLLGSALPGHAWRGHSGHHGYGHHGYGHHGYRHYGYGHSGYRTYGHRYPYRYYSYAAPEVSPQQPTVYVQQQAYWYYCENAKAYYPYVQQCPSGWVRVVPPTTGPGQ